MPACDCCFNETALELLYPFPLANKPYKTGFRCNICLDTENRLIAEYGMLRDELNKRLEDQPFSRSDVSFGPLRKYLHLKVFPEETDLIVPFVHFPDKSAEQRGIEGFLDTQNDVMLNNELSTHQVTSMVSFISAMLDQSAQKKSISPAQVRTALKDTFGEESGEE